MPKRIIITVTNNLLTDQRVFRVSKFLLKQGYDIQLVGRKIFDEKPKLDKAQIKLFKLWFNKGAFFYANYNIRLFFFLLFNRFDIVLSNDLDTLPAAFFVSKIKRKTIVYDSHEYFTQVPELVDRHFQQSVWLWFERLIVPKLKYAYTVSQSIADEYKKMYGTNFIVVRNVPEKKEKVNKSNKNQILIYQGALNKDRGIELMIDAMQYLENTMLWIAGIGDVEEMLKRRVNNLNLNQKISFLGKISPDKLHSITSQACIGLSLEKDVGLNYHYGLPNKLFDYIQARIPVLVSDLPEMKNIVNQYGIGEILYERTPQNTAKVLAQMLASTEKNLLWKDNLEKTSEELIWENESKKLLTLFHSICANKK